MAPPTEKLKEMVHPRSISTAVICCEKGSTKTKSINVLFDSGTSALVIGQEAVEKLKNGKNNSTEWNAFAGEMNAGCKCSVDFILPEFSTFDITDI